jgi:carboxymethylenebutenolidase
MRDPSEARPEAEAGITQEMIQLYDEYTHLTLDRRGFMDKLSKLAGGTAAAAAIAPMLAADKAKAAVVAEDDPRLKIETVTIPGPDGSISAYMAAPAEASGPLPAVIVVHENRGLNPHIEDVTRRIALEGFVALGVDFLSFVGGTPEDEDQARQMFTTLDMPKATQEGVAAIVWLKSNPATNGKVGVIGFCWGGGMANRIAVASPDLGAAVAYYGQQPSAADAAKIKARLLLHYAGLDDRINAGIPAYAEALKAAGVDYQIYLYEGANHAFNNDTSAARYDKAAADLAWSRTVEFLKTSLS